MLPQTTLCTANAHTLPSVGTSVHVMLVYLVTSAQLPQFDARMLKKTSLHPNTKVVQVNVSVTDCSTPVVVKLMLAAGVNYMQKKF